MSRSGKGKRVAIFAATLLVTALAMTTWFLRDRLWEGYWIHQLEHGEEAEARIAAEMLGEIRSTRAIPGLIQWTDYVAAQHGMVSVYDWVSPYERQSTILRERLRQQEAEKWTLNWPGQTLVRIGAPAVSPLLEAMRYPHTGSIPSGERAQGQRKGRGLARRLLLPSWLEQTLSRMGDETIPALQAACSDPDATVSLVAAEALKNIEATHALPR